MDKGAGARVLMDANLQLSKGSGLGRSARGVRGRLTPRAFCTIVINATFSCAVIDDGHLSSLDPISGMR